MAQRRKTDTSRNPPPLGVVTRSGEVRPPRNRRSGTRTAAPRFPIVIEFARGHATPRAESLAELHRVGEWLSRNAGERVTIVGHANQRASDRAAAGLARARVATVVDLLALLGADRSQLVALRATRLHSVPVGSTRGERRLRRVVVVHHHAPTVGVASKAVRALKRRRGAARR